MFSLFNLCSLDLLEIYRGLNHIHPHKASGSLAFTTTWYHSRVLGPKKKPLFSPNHVLATTEQSCQEEKYPFPK